MSIVKSDPALAATFMKSYLLAGVDPEATLTGTTVSGGRLNLFGWVNPLNGEHDVMKAVQGNTEAFLAQLQMLVERFQGKIVDLWVDNASWHKGKRVREFLEPSRRWFHLHYHPPYHPELNPQERI